jgi:hypothetical protein
MVMLILYCPKNKFSMAKHHTKMEGTSYSAPGSENSLSLWIITGVGWLWEVPKKMVFAGGGFSLNGPPTIHREEE